MTAPRRQPVRVALTTANAPGAVAIVQLHGRDLAPLLEHITGETNWPAGRMRLVSLAGIDRGMAVLWPGRDGDVAQLMPHGGPRVVRLLVDRLIELGATIDAEPDPARLYPEADSPIEADALAAIARAASPAAIDLLAAQPTRWREVVRDGRLDPAARPPVPDPRDRLIDPPTVVLAGRPNVGKSTLTNRVLGRAASLVADLPGTTRDWVAGLAELSFAFRALSSGSTRMSLPDAEPEARNYLAVRWLDTPGLRDSDDPIEREAITLARNVVAGADVLIAMRDPTSDWPAPADLPRTPDLWLLNKSDLLPEAHHADAQHDRDATLGSSPEIPLRLSAARGDGLDALQHAIAAALGLHAIKPASLWAFSPTLRAAVRDPRFDLTAYLRPARV